MTGTRVVLVHGSMDRAAGLRAVVDRLTDLDVTTYDRRGYGSRTAEPVHGSIEEHVGDLMLQIGATAAVVVGHSYGASVALAAAARHPERVLAIGAFEPALRWLSWWPEVTSAAVAIETAARSGTGAAVEKFVRSAVGDAAWEGMSDDARSARQAEGPALIAELAGLGRDEPPFTLADIGVPTVAGTGTRSPSHLRRAARTVAAEVPGAELYEITDAPHAAHLTHPAEFADFVRRVVARV
ncbi:MAG TPA: alpha/beta hydrolase [Acidimicrobiales bacterium]|nr:alpha/beta hydrolase [Acidimicrobiales bacterium]